MRAIQMTEFGGPEVLSWSSCPRPEPGPEEVLIRVTRAGRELRGHAHAHQLLRAEGDAPAGARRRGGGRARGHGRARGRAGRATAATPSTPSRPPSACSRSPTSIDDGTALALVIQGTTAWHLYRTAGRVAEGESVVVHAAAGGVGSLAVQLGRPLGAGRVIATASSEEKRALALELGADVAIDRRRRGPDRAADRGQRRDARWTSSSTCPAGAVFDASYRALAPFGRIVVCGIATSEAQRGAHGLAAAPLARGGRLLPLSLPRAPRHVRRGARRPVRRARRAGGELRAIVGHTYPLEQAAQAQIDLRARRTTGKLLLDPSA